MRLNGEDREFLASNGFILKTIPTIWNEDNLSLPVTFSTKFFNIVDQMGKACLKHKVTHGYVVNLHRLYDVLSVLEHMGSDIISVIKPLGCKIKDERR